MAYERLNLENGTVLNETHIQHIEDAIEQNTSDIENLGGMVKLWENEDPTVAFAAQTVTLDLSGYSRILIDFIFTTSATINPVYSQYAKIDTTVTLVSYSSNGQYVGARVATVSETGVGFGTAYYNFTTTNPQYSIPLAIYGVKEA